MSHLRAVPDGPTGPRESTVPPRSGSASSVRVEAPGKVNLFLSVGAPGPDGYHPLTTVFQAVRLIETVTARRQSAQDHGTVTLTLEEPDADVPVDESNLAVRAATLLAQTTGVSEGVDLLLRKRVPVAGGMAGGSADAAAALVACNALWGTGLSLPELSALAARLGADVPFPLTGATAVGSGRGDLVTPIMTRGAYHWVFALAEEGLSTPAVFRRFDELTGGGQPAVRDVPEALTAALRAGDARALAGSLHNDLQAAALDLRPELAEVIAVAEEAGHGIGGLVDGRRVAVGSPRWIDAGPLKARVEDLEAEGQTCVLVTVDGFLAGAIGVRDELRPEVPEVVRTLRDQGVEVSMLTGDNSRTAAALAKLAGIGDVHAELRPEDKARIVAGFSETSPTAMIGDGINDAPALAGATVGIAMGATGSDAAIESADVAFTGHDLGLIPQALRHARRGGRIINQNIVLSLAIITVLLPLAITGVLGLAAVVLVHEVAEVVVIANGLRAARARKQ